MPCRGLYAVSRHQVRLLPREVVASSATVMFVLGAAICGTLDPPPT